VCSDVSSGSRRTSLEARSRMTTALFQRTLVVSCTREARRAKWERGTRRRGGRDHGTEGMTKVGGGRTKTSH